MPFRGKPRRGRRLGDEEIMAKKAWMRRSAEAEFQGAGYYRCSAAGRSRGTLRKFRCAHLFPQLALRGEIPACASSW